MVKNGVLYAWIPVLYYPSSVLASVEHRDRGGGQGRVSCLHWRSRSVTWSTPVAQSCQNFKLLLFLPFLKRKLLSAVLRCISGVHNIQTEKKRKKVKQKRRLRTRNGERGRQRTLNVWQQGRDSHVFMALRHSVTLPFLGDLIVTYWLFEELREKQIFRMKKKMFGL